MLLHFRQWIGMCVWLDTQLQLGNREDVLSESGFASGIAEQMLQYEMVTCHHTKHIFSTSFTSFHHAVELHN
jgi:hypothetical protein